MKLCLLILACLPATLQARKLSFLEAVDRMMERDPAFQGELHSNQAGQALLIADRRAFYPTLDAALIKTQVDPWARDADRTDQSRWQADLRLNIYRFGGDKARYGLATEGEDFYKASEERLKLAAESDAVRRILAYIAAVLDQQVLEKIRRIRGKLFDVANQQYKKGLLAQQELKKVELDQKTLDLQLRSSEIAVRQAQADLASFLGGDAVAVAWPMTAKVRTDAGRVLNEIGQDVSAHPSLRAAEKGLRMEEARESAAWASQYPTLDAQASVGRSLDGRPVDEGATQFFLSLTVPIFDRAVSSSQYSSQVERRLAADQNVAAVKRGLAVSLDQSRAALKENLEIVSTYSELIGSAQQLYQDAVHRFERGLVSVNDLSVDEARLYTAERDSVRSWHDLHVNWAAACNAQGLRLRSCWKPDSVSSPNPQRESSR